MLATYQLLGLGEADAERWAATAYATFIRAVGLSDQAAWSDDQTREAWVEHWVNALVPRPSRSSR